MEQYNNKLIYHYTSSSGLLGILSSESLWFTDFSVLNDESEGNYIYSLVKDVLYSGEYSKEYISSPLTSSTYNFPINVGSSFNQCS